MTNDIIDHHFMPLLDVCIASFIKQLFKFSIFFLGFNALYLSYKVIYVFWVQWYCLISGFCQ